MYRSRPPSFHSLSLTLSLSLARLHLPRSFENCALGLRSLEVTVRLWLPREFSGFLRALPRIRRVAGFVFSISMCTSAAFRSLGDTVKRRRVAHLSLSFFFFLSLSFFFIVSSLSRKRRWDLTLCGSDASVLLAAPCELIARRFVGMHSQHERRYNAEVTLDISQIG